MPTPQNKRNLIASIDGVERKIEAYSGGKRKRVDSPKDVIPAGSNVAQKLHDPANTVEPLTGKFICYRDDPFVGRLHALYEQHLQNPNSAGGFTIYSRDDDLTVLDSMVYTNAVLQSVSPPEGDRQNSDMLNIEFECQPDNAIVDG